MFGGTEASGLLGFGRGKDSQMSWSSGGWNAPWQNSNHQYWRSQYLRHRYIQHMRHQYLLNMMGRISGSRAVGGYQRRTSNGLGVHSSNYVKFPIRGMGGSYLRGFPTKSFGDGNSGRKSYIIRSRYNTPTTKYPPRPVNLSWRRKTQKTLKRQYNHQANKPITLVKRIVRRNKIGMHLNKAIISYNIYNGYTSFLYDTVH